MAFTVSRALQLEIFDRCKVLTGQAGLHNIILAVNILEILDDLRHIEPGEFLITTAHDFNAQSESMQQGMIELFAARQLAALAIQTGHYLEKIPPAFIRFAEEHNIPLIEIPPELSFKSLTRALMSELIRSEQTTAEAQPSASFKSTLETEAAAMKILWQRLINSKNPEELGPELSNFNFRSHDPLLALVVTACHPEAEESEQATALANLEFCSLDEVVIYKVFKQKQMSFLLGPYRQYLSILIQLKHPGKPQAEAEAEITRLIHGELKQLFPDLQVQLGTSSVYSDLRGIMQALGEAEKALHAAQIGLPDGKNQVTYRSLGLYRLIMDINNIETLKLFFTQSTAPLLDYDQRCRGALLQTLKVFLASASIKKAAETLFVHRHTMKYRLEQIEKLTSLNPLQPIDALQLNIGLHIYYYLQALKILP